VIQQLCIKAGRNILDLIRDGGFDWNRVGVYYGSACGPRWLVTSGFDLSILKRACLGRTRSVLLAGASSGAWRFAAWPLPEPVKAYEMLRQAYIEAEYRRDDTPQSIRKSLSDIIDLYIEDDALPFALANRNYRLAVIAARAKTLAASETPWLQKTGLGLCFAGNFLHASTIYRFFERIVFYSGPKPPVFCLNSAFRGRHLPLNQFNFKHAVLASGAIPLVVAGVHDIFGAPRGVYRDGGLVDYHINEPFSREPGDITLFFHHQEHSRPTWMDKNLKSRRTPQALMDHVLMIHPTSEFVATLPDGKIPDRTDFLTYIDDQPRRIRNWQQAVHQSAHLGEVFCELVESGRIKNAVLPID
jgi:hypothetical protein